MSATVDSRVVEMRFDNKQFEDGVASTMSTLEKLKEKLNMRGATKGMEEVDAAAKRVNLTGLGNAVESVQARFSALEVMGVTALANLTNSAVNAGKKIISALTIEPIKTGLQEYETQINAVQTILANTESKGTTLQQVNAALDTLNTYADKTIYNFTEMTRNIGTFTAAGVDLKTSVNAIQGIANLAAVSGSSSQQASTAMYQLSQALSSGTVKLMDWNSVVNAGMGGQVFQDALKETAKVHGVNVDKMIKKHGSFRETLQEGWITSDILTETLSHFTMAAEEGSEQWEKYKKSLTDSGYSEKQAEAILKMSNTATEAATKVKTATQLYDTLKETAQSGWTQTWEIIMGDFGEAKELYSGIYETLSPILEATAEARNNLLSGGLSSGWKQLLGEGIADEQGYVESIKSVANEHGVAIDDMIKAEQELDSSLTENEAFQKVLKKGLADGTISSDMLSESVTNLADKMRGMSDKEREAAGYTKEHIEQIEELEKGLKDGSISMDEFVEKMKRPSGRENLIDSLYNSFKAVMSIITPIKQAFSEIFPALKPEQLYRFTENLKEFTAKLKLSDTASENLKRTFKGLFAIIDIAKQIFGAVIKAISPLFGKVDDLGGGILGVTAKIGDWLVGLNESIKASGFFTTAVEKIHKAFEKVKNFLQPVIEGINQFANEVKTNLTAVATNAETRLGPLSALGKFITGVFVGLGNVVKKIFPYVASAASAIGNVLGELMNRISDATQNANYDGLFDFISSGVIATIGVFIAKFMKSGADILDGAGGFVENINGILEGVGDALGAFTDSLKADTLKKIATAIGILAVSLLVLSLIPSEKLTTALFSITTLFGELMGSMAIFGKLGDMKGITKTAGALVGLASAMLVLSIALKIMSTMSWSEMGVGLISLTVGLGAMVGAVALLALLPEKDLKSSTKAIKTLASSLLILSVALKIMSTMSWEQMGVALISMVVGLGALVGAIWLLPKDTALRAAGLIGLAAAMVVLGVALKIMATMSWGELAVSLVALAGSLAIIAIAMNLMIAAVPGALAMLIVAPALIALAVAMKILGSMSWEEVGIGLVALGGALALLAIGMTAMMVALPGASALLVAAGALAILTPVLMALGSMSLTEIGMALLTLAGVFAVLGVAALVLAPVIPAILGLAGAVALLGVACLAIGAGVLMIGVGVTALAAALAAGGGAITVFISSLISLIPFIIEQVGLGIIKLCEVIAGSGAAICDALTVLIVAAVDALVTAVPHLVEGVLVLLTSLLDSLITHLPTIVTQLVTILVSLMALLAEHAPTLVEGLFVLIGAIIQSIADNITRLVQPLVDLITAIVQGIADAIGPIIQGVIAPIVQLLVDILSGIAVVITAVGAAIAVALRAVASVFDSVFNGIANVVTSVGESIRTVLDGFAGIIDSFASAIDTSLNGVAGIFDSVFNGIATVIESVGNSIKSILDGIAGVIESIGEAALNAGTGFENLAKGVKIITDLKLTDMVASLAAVAGGVGDIASHAGKIEKVGTGIGELSLVANVAAKSFSTLLKTFSSVMKALVDTIENFKTTAKKVCTALASGCAEAISGKAGSFESAGKDLGAGLVKGINAKQTAVYNAGYALGQKAVQGEKDGQKSKSPSKLTILAGKWLGEGLVIGMEKMGNKVYNAGYMLGESATKTISSTISRISDIVSSDIDAQPTIRPVIDLGGVRSGVNAISGMLNMDSQVGVRANISAISSMMSQNGQNGSNADVVAAINKLRKDLGKVGGDTYQVNGVTYDDGSNINNAIKAIVRQARIERRV